MVQHGDKRGRDLGYPTANLELGTYLRPRYGIYAVTGRLLDSGEVLKGAANLGIRPSFDPPKELLEPYFFDFDGDLYGQEIEVALHPFPRPEAKFDSLAELKAQMAEARRRRRSCLDEILAGLGRPSSLAVAFLLLTFVNASWLRRRAGRRRSS